MMRMAAGRFSGAERLVPGFSKPSKTPAEMAAAPLPANPAASGGRGRGGSGPQLHANDWNTVQLILDADVLAISVNQGPGGRGTTNHRTMGFRPLALSAAR